MNQFYERKDIKREFSVARTPQQNGVAKRKNRTLIEAARTMLANSKLPTTFYAKVVNIACYVQNMVLVTKPYNKTPYELFLGRKPALVFMRPFGYPVTILNTIDHLGKFDGKADERFFVGYSISSKAFRVFNNRTRIVKENLHVQFSENTPNIARSTKACNDASKARMESVPGKDYILLPLKKGGDPSKEGERGDQEKDADVNSTNSVYTVSSPVNAADLPVDPNMPPLEDIVYSVNDEDVGAESNMNNLNAFMPVSPIPTTRVHKDHPVEQIIGDLNLAPQTRRMTKNLEEYWFVSTTLKQTTNNKDLQNRLFACFLSQEEPKKTLVELPNGKWAIDGCQECFSLGKIKEEVYVCQPPGFEDPDFPDRVYKVEKKFGFTEVKTTSTPMKTQKPLLKDEDGEEVDVYLYRSMIGSLMYLTSLRPDIMYLKGQPKLGLWYPKDSPFDLVANTDSDYAGASLDRKSTTGEWNWSNAGDSKFMLLGITYYCWLNLQLEDVEGVDCLPNATIFEQLILMGPKTTAWNEFSSTMTSVIICLATNQKFNFSKLIFESMMKNLDNVSGKFLMYPRFVQVFLDQQLDDMSIHKRIYVAPSHTKKVFANMRRGEGSAMPTDPQHIPTITQASTSQPKKTQKHKKPKKNTEVPQPSGSTDYIADEVVYKKLDDSLVRAATTASSLEAEQDIGNNIKTRSKATPNEAGSQGTTSGGGPKRQDTIGDAIAQNRFENVSKTSNDSLLAGVNTTRSDEDSMKLKELIEFCTKLQQKVLDLENTKTTQAHEITNLELRVKKLEKKGGSRTHKLKFIQEDASKQGTKIDDIDKDVEITLVDETQGRYGDDLMFNTGVLDDEEVFTGQDMAEKEINVAEKEVSTANPVTTTGEVVTIASVEISTSSPTKTTIIDDLTLDQTLIKIRSAKPKVKGVMIGEQKLIRLDEEIASKLQAEFDEEVRLAREKAEKEQEANIALTEEWDDIQAKIKADHELAQRLQAQEQEELSDAEKATLFRFQNTFVDFRIDLVEGSSKRSGEELEQENVKKQKVDDDKETAELKSLMEVMPDKEEVALDAIPLAVKSPSIVDWKIHKEGKKRYYQIIRANGSSKMYLVFSHMLKSFDREDLETLYKLVKDKYGSTRPVEDLNLVLYGDLKTMFELHVEDNVWKNQSDYRVLDWKLYDSCGVHSLRTQNVHIHILVEKKYPLTTPIITYMLNRKLQADHWNEMCY
ncbi:ribonuclease H-like domain-containing protein [Tanacetum coccineum]